MSIILCRFSSCPNHKHSESHLEKKKFFVFVIEIHRTGTSNPTFLLRKNGKEFVLRHKAPVEVYIGYHKVLVDVPGWNRLIIYIKKKKQSGTKQNKTKETDKQIKKK